MLAELTADCESLPTDLLPGNVPKTARVFSCLAAMWAFKKARRCERKVSMDNGCGLVAWAESCHWAGDKSTMTERCDAFSIVDCSGSAK